MYRLYSTVSSTGNINVRCLCRVTTYNRRALDYSTHAVSDACVATRGCAATKFLELAALEPDYVYGLFCLPIMIILSGDSNDALTLLRGEDGGV